MNVTREQKVTDFKRSKLKNCGDIYIITVLPGVQRKDSPGTHQSGEQMLCLLVPT
jgi:hypothetical protein